MAIKYTMLFGFTSNRSGENPLPSRTAGDSESYYDVLSEPKPAAFDDLCIKRAQMLPRGCAIVGQRIQKVDPNGPASTNAKFFPGPSYATNTADIPQMALRMSFIAGDGFNKITKTLRLIPDSQVIEGEYSPSTAFRNAVMAFGNQLVVGQWCFRAVDKANPNIPLLSIAANGAVVSVVAHGLNVNDKVIITRGKDSAGRAHRIDGRVISVTDALTFQVYPGPQVALTGGYSRKKVIVYPVVSSTEVGRITTHKVGRPFDGYRGRASKRRR